MAVKTAEECIRRILVDIEKRKTVDYGDKLSLRRYSAAYDRIIKNAQYIDTHYPEQIGLLLTLLKHPDTQVISCCAPIVLKLNSCTIDQKWDAIHAIKKLIEDNSLSKADKLAFSFNLKKWKKELNEQSLSVED